MQLIDILLLSLGLGADCFAISVSQSQLSKTFRLFDFLLMALLFGLFQGCMPLITYFAGAKFVDFFSRLSHWTALILLAILGAKMIYDSFHEEQSIDVAERAFSLHRLLLLAVATSIDALVTGVLFIPCPEKLWLGVGIIALGSFVLSMLGSALGYLLGKRFNFNAELLGGVVLIAIGLKIFISYYI